MSNMPKPKSRPKCPSCAGEGHIKMFEYPDLSTPSETWPCSYCDGQGHDPYYTGQEDDNAHS